MRFGKNKHGLFYSRFRKKLAKGNPQKIQFVFSKGFKLKTPEIRCDVSSLYNRSHPINFFIKNI